MKNIENIFDEWLNSEETINRKLSNTTIKNYTNTAKNINFGIMNGQNTLIKKLKENYENPNTRATFLNMIILLRNFKEQDTDKLINYRNLMKKEINTDRKIKLKDSNEELPTLEYLESQLKNLDGMKYIINYLFINYGFRNKDINFKYVTELPEDGKENYLTQVKGGLKMVINDYKTNKSFGTKVYFIRDKDFMKKWKKVELKDGDYILNNNNSKYSQSRFNEIVKKLSIDNLGETNIFKIVVKDLLEKKDYKKIEELSASRGTSLDTIMRSYNLENNK
jgi:hypothetical protein|tara:strand:- start:1169 stop:2005 length:837 start_codon:yes stop_codon:yes gene_type:complete